MFSSAFLRVRTIPVLKDNYSYLLTCARSGCAALVDVCNVDEVIAGVNAEGTKPEDLKFLLSTHKHWDHCGGNEKFVKHHAASHAADFTVVGGEHEAEIACVTKRVKDGESFNIGELVVSVLHTPCHTRGHVLYHAFHPEDSANGVIFTGDTLFVAGCGAFFEGNAQDMLSAFKRVLAEVPGTTRIFCGHEYTTGFLEGALKIEPDNSDMTRMLEWCQTQRKKKEPTMGTLLQDEMKYNVYMRALSQELKDKLQIQDEVQLLQKVYDST
eukprot:PhM_4_TR14210/c0_g1_i1/m.15181/K01069/E3.1.2.6, gloB; hydroxyacylglutathione hydrolase